MSFSWLETATFITKHIPRSPSYVASELSNVSTVRPRFLTLTINQILGPHSGPHSPHSPHKRLCLIGKKVGEKRKKRAFITYILIFIYLYIFFTSKPVTRTAKQVLPKLVAYLNNRVLLLMALPCNGCPSKFDVHNKY